MKKLKLQKKITHAKQSVETKMREKKRLKKKGSGKLKNGILGFLMVFGIMFAAGVLAFGLYIIFTAPEFNTTLLYNKEATVLYDNKGVELTRYGKENRVLITYNDLPQVLVDAIVATEDSRYFQHNGFDAARFLKASMGQALGNSGAGGASTLTMQLVKNTYTSNKANGIQGLVRKFTDIYMAIFKIEKKYTKEEILEFYVNSQEFGVGGTNFGSINGVEQASQYYFGKSVSDLNLSEASLIAGLFNNPYLFNPYNHPNNATSRRSTVLSLMVKHGYISEEQKKEAESIPVQSLLKPTQSNNKKNPYQAFIDFVIDQVEEKTGVSPYQTPMAIYTTLDTGIQDVVNDVVNNQNGYKFLNEKDEVGIAVTSVADGGILAMNGGRNYVPQGINRATVQRQPGSTAKPLFDYGPMIEYNNVSTVHQFFDEPYTYSNGVKINNYDGQHKGLRDMKYFLIDSRNIPAVQAFQQVDKKNIAEFAHNLGITFDEALYEPTAIGGFDPGMSPLESSAAYSAFARGGYYIEPYAYSKIVYLETDKTEEYKPTKKRVMSEETAYMITSMLAEGGSSSWNVGGNIRISGTDVAAKGGTTNITGKDATNLKIPDYATPDHWNVTYTTDYCISLWYGYDPMGPGNYLTSNTGTSGRKKIMQSIANRIYLPNKRFTKPNDVIEVTVEKESIPYQLPSEFTPDSLKIKGYYKKGTEPTEVSNRFSQLETPSNGKASVSGTKVSLTWDPIKTPSAIDNDSLINYFNSGYKQWADKYRNQRINYNNRYIGTNGYQIYLQDANGNLSSLGYTNNNYFTYNATGTNTNYTFVVKSAYSIFKSNMSSGLTIKASVNQGTEDPDPITELKLTLNGNSSICVKLNEKFIDLKSPLKVLYLDKDVTSEAVIKANTDFDTSTPHVETLTYTVTYKDKTATIKRTINICNTCNTNGTCAT